MHNTAPRQTYHTITCNKTPAFVRYIVSLTKCLLHPYVESINWYNSNSSVEFLVYTTLILRFEQRNINDFLSDSNIIYGYYKQEKMINEHLLVYMYISNCLGCFSGLGIYVTGTSLCSA